MVNNVLPMWLMRRDYSVSFNLSRARRQSRSSSGWRKIAAQTRAQIEAQTGRSIVSPERASDYILPVEDTEALPFDDGESKKEWLLLLDTSRKVKGSWYHLILSNRFLRIPVALLFLLWGYYAFVSKNVYKYIKLRKRRQKICIFHK